MRTKSLPKSLYVRIERPANDEPYFVSADNMSELGIDVGDKTKIGLYQLVGTYDAEGMVETSKLQKSE